MSTASLRNLLHPFKGRSKREDRAQVKRLDDDSSSILSSATTIVSPKDLKKMHHTKTKSSSTEELDYGSAQYAPT
ncbi:hypothetical protein BBP40_005594 [Aspergillus hancockii]|nr:hypothetical protein BBP40_005594 [Aspergillus hancockii]